MTLEEVNKRVEEVRTMAGDAEIAHGAEDSLHTDVLAAISNGECEDPAACASAALKTIEIEFTRWYS